MQNSFFTFSFLAAGLTDIGAKRENNEDRIYLDPEKGFFAVSDGMGGLRHGDKASDYVKEALPGLIGTYTENLPPEMSPEEAAEALKVLIGIMSDTLFRAGNERTDGKHRFEYGATLLGVWLFGERAIYLCLGDSRGYLLKKDGERLEQVTQDMNVAALMVRNGLMTPKEAAESSVSNRLTAFVGMEAPATPESFVRMVSAGDVILLCSDGLYGMVPETEIVSLLRSGKEAEAVCRELIDTANRYGGRDNISAIVIVIGERKGNTEEENKPSEG